MLKKNLPATPLLIILILYVSGIATVSFFHELWRDELQAWMLVRSSGSVAGLMYNTRYEGHPSLWFFMLYGLKAISPGLQAMKILHLLISSITGWIILRFSPFTTLQKILILTGYFFFYEYAVIARNYAAGIMFLFAACAMFPYRNSSGYFTLIAVAAAGMMLSNFYTFFIGSAFMLLLFAGHISDPVMRRKWRSLIPGYLVMTAGIVLFLADTLPPPDYGYANTWHTDIHILKVWAMFARLAQVFIPVPQSTVQFWNTVFYTPLAIQAILGIALTLLIICVVAKRGLARWFILFIFFLILGFSYFKFNGYMRHNGHLYMAFLAMLWLQAYLPGKETRWKKVSTGFIYGILTLQVLASVISVVCEVKYPFSQAGNTAAYINEYHKSAIVVAHEDTGASSVAIMLDRPVFYPRSGEFGTYITWNTQRLKRDITTAIMVRNGDSLANQYHLPVIYVTTTPCDSAANYGLSLLKSFTPSVEPLESYWVYSR